MLENELGRDPTPEEVASRLDISVERVLFAFKVSRPNISWEKPVGEDRESEFGDFIEDDYDLADDAERSVMNEQLEELLASLPFREARILRLRFGLYDGKAHTLKEVGKLFGVTRERIRQIETEALQRLRRPDRSKRLR